jgi:LacI family transcriptional regulator
MITIKEIAKLSGVSFSTVSKALNNSSLVTAATKRKVLEVAEQYGYSKNLLAQSLATGKSNMIGLIWQDVVNPVYAQLAMQFYHYFRNHDYEVVMTMTPPEQAVNLFKQLRVDGLIFWGDLEGKTNQFAKRLRELKMPVLIVGSSPDQNFPSIQIDRKAGVREAVSYFQQQGHRRIGMIGSTQESKVQAYKEALLDAGLPFAPEYIVPCELSWERGYEAMMNIPIHPNSPTAYIGCNNLLTRGALRALKERGVHVPEEISLIGYDELPEMAYAEVPLTTVGPSLEEIAVKTVESMIALIQMRDVEASTWITPVLNVRKSVMRVTKD